jgi:hypothetical protein
MSDRMIIAETCVCVDNLHSISLKPNHTSEWVRMNKIPTRLDEIRQMRTEVSITSKNMQTD